MNTSYGGGRGKRRTQSKDHNSRAAAVVDDPDVPLHSTYPPHHSHNYTAPHDMRRESNQSRNRRSDVDNWQPRGETSQTVHDTRYNLSNVNDSHRRNRSGRDVYDRQDQRDVDLWQPRSGNDHYASSSREWAAEDYPQAFPSSTYDEPNYSSAHANRSAAYEWGVDDDRRLADPAPRYTDDPPPHRWGRDHSRESGGRQQQRFVSDSGWDTRFAERETRVPAEEPSKTEETRKWEPAPAWKQNANRPAPPRNQRNQQHHNNGNRNNHQNKSGKGGKKQWNNNKKNHQRDWRGDDSHLNNWTKRDNSQVANANRIPLKRRQPRSRSHSRSHSPTASYYSRRSGRSHSRSPSPKRMRQSPSPVRPTSSPVVKRQKGNRKRRYQASQAFRERGRTRHRSVSPPSRSSRSVSSASSQSSKDVDRPKTVHRLPTATSIKEIDISLSLSKASVSRSSRPKPSRVLPEIVLDGSPTHTDYASAHPHADSDLPSSVMLPPPQPSALSYSAPLTNFSHTNQELPSVDTLVAAPKGIRPRNAGFKPIGQTSSSLRRFFPGDEDEESDPSVAPPTPRKRSSAMHPDVSVHQPNDLPEPMPVDVDTSNIPVPSTPPFYDPLMRPSFNDEPTVDPRLTKDPRLAKMTNGHGNLHMPSIDPSEPALEVRRNELYSIVSQVGEGTFGKVYKARNTNTGVHVALKRVRMEAERDGFPVTAMREIKLLQSLQHPNVVCLYEMMVSNGSVYMVFEYMDHDLTGVLSQTQFSFTDAQLKSLCQQMLRGLAYLHHKGVIHRDIKGSNILVNNRGELKLADFGLARFYQKRRQSDYTNRVITLWYRPPELLFGTTVYGPEVDMWSAGCIMLELFTKKPVFQGNDEIHQLDVMYRVLGTPSSDRWPGISDMPWYELIKPRDVVASPFRDLFKKWLSPCGLELAEQLLDYDPSQRITAVQALQHPYFLEEDPPPELPTGLSTLEGEWHELETKREKARKRKKESSMH